MSQVVRGQLERKKGDTRQNSETSFRRCVRVFGTFVTKPAEERKRVYTVGWLGNAIYYGRFCGWVVRCGSCVIGPF